MHLIYEVTYKCPAKCPQCLVGKKSETADISTFLSVLRIFKSLACGRYLLTISGGEPTVLKNLREYVDAGKKMGYRVTVVTNGYDVDRLLRAKPDFVQVSVDYYGKRHDEHRGIDLWENVLRIVDTIKAGELKGFIRVTLMNDNLEDLKKIHSLGVPVLAMPIRKRPDRAPSREQVVEAMKYATLPTNCPVGRGQFVITPELRCLDCIFARNYVCSLNPLDSESFRHMLRKYGQLQPYPCGEPYWWSQ